MNRKIKNPLLVLFGMIMLNNTTSAQFGVEQTSEITTADMAAKLLQPYNSNIASLGFTPIYSPVLNWVSANMVVKDLAITSDKSMWVINAKNEVWRFQNNAWSNAKLYNASRIAAEGNNVWVIGNNNELFSATSGTGYSWQKMPGSATDIAMGGGVVWTIGKMMEIRKLVGLTWQPVGGQAVKVAVDKSGNPWVVNSGGEVYEFKNNTFYPLPVSPAKDIAVAGDSIWILGTDGSVSRWADGKQSKAGGRDFQQLICDYSGTPWAIDANKLVLKGVRQQIGVKAEIDTADNMKDYFTAPAPVAKAITITQGGGYTAWITLSYVGADGKTNVAIDQKNIALGWTKTFNFTGNETNFKLTIKDATGLAWDPWKTVYNQSWSDAKDVCIKVYGTTLNPKWSSDCK
jgi:hypothetical protein